jgi:hypothetical protein
VSFHLHSSRFVQTELIHESHKHNFVVEEQTDALHE